MEDILESELSVSKNTVINDAESTEKITVLCLEDKNDFIYELDGFCAKFLLEINKGAAKKPIDIIENLLEEYTVNNLCKPDVLADCRRLCEDLLELDIIKKH